MCQHEKVYADYALMSNPPQKPWICKKCGEKGSDVVIDSIKQQANEQLQKDVKEG